MIRKYMTPGEKMTVRKNFEELFGHEDPTKLCQSDRDVFCNTFYSNLGQYVKPYQKVALIRYMHAWVTQISDLSEYRRAIDHAMEGARVARNLKQEHATAKPPAPAAAKLAAPKPTDVIVDSKHYESLVSRNKELEANVARLKAELHSIMMSAKLARDSA